MKRLYFYINGSGSPFWLNEGTDIYGKKYYSNIFYPTNPSEKYNSENYMNQSLSKEHQPPTMHIRFLPWTNKM